MQFPARKDIKLIGLPSFSARNGIKSPSFAPMPSGTDSVVIALGFIQPNKRKN